MSKRRDLLQNITITALSLTALLLLSQTQFFHLGATVGRTYLSVGVSDETSAAAEALGENYSAPVCLVVTDDYATGGSIHMTTADEDFLLLKGLLAEALGSASAGSACTQADFRSALALNAVFCDFYHPLPLQYLAALCGTSTALELTARSVLVAQEAEGVFLFLWDGAQQYYRCPTALQEDSLSAAPAQADSVAFAWMLEDARFLFPFTVLPLEAPELHTLAASSAVNTEALLTALDFNPHTNSRYTESGGAVVILEGDRTLRLQTDGSMLYQGGVQAPLQISAQSDTPTVQEAVSGAYALLSALPSAGDAGLYLESVQQEGRRMTLRFGYQLHGVPIRLSGSRCAAEVSLFGNAVTALSCALRQYALTEEVSPLLPLTQAAAVAAAQGGTALSVAYADRGGDLVPAAWLAE